MTEADALAIASCILIILVGAATLAGVIKFGKKHEGDKKDD